MKKAAAAFMICLCIISLGGCKGKVESLKLSDIKEETLLVRSDGTLQLGADETFDKIYYDEKDLKDFMNEAIDSFNDKNGKGSVKLSGFKVEEQKAKAIFTYDSIESYSEMNRVDASLYTMKEAMEAKVLPASYTDAVDGTKATLDDVKENEKYKVFVINTKVKVKIPGSIKYYANAMLTDADSAETTGDKTAVIVYK